MKTYVVKYAQHEKVYTDVRFAELEAKRLRETGVSVYVYVEVDGVREDEPLISLD